MAFLLLLIKARPHCRGYFEGAENLPQRSLPENSLEAFVPHRHSLLLAKRCWRKLAPGQLMRNCGQRLSPALIYFACFVRERAGKFLQCPIFPALDLSCGLSAQREEEMPAFVNGEELPGSKPAAPLQTWPRLLVFFFKVRRYLSHWPLFPFEKFYCPLKFSTNQSFY